MGGPDMGAKRNCTGCGKPLSRYNTGNRCQACISADRATPPRPAGNTAGLHVDAARLAQLRHDRGWTQDMLADRAGLSREIVRKLEQQARRSARISTLSALAGALAVPVSVLLGEQRPAGESTAPLDPPAPQTPDTAPSQPTLLRELTGQRHWQRFETFRRQFQNAAQELARLEHDPDLAKLTVSLRQWERWYSGHVKTEPYPDACRVLEHMFGYPVSQLLMSRAQSLPLQERTGDEGLQEDEEDMERRRLLKSLAALGVAISPIAHDLDNLRASLGSAFGHTDCEHLDDWEEAIVEYGYTYLAMTPADLIGHLASDVVSVRSIARTIPADHPRYHGWCRISGALSCLMAKSLSNVGQPWEARKWWNTAQHLTDESGDLDLSLWVRGQRIIHGLYEHQPAPLLLRRIGKATELAGSRPCVGNAEICTGRAQALALGGDHSSAERELRRTEVILGQLPVSVTANADSIMGWGEAQLRYTESWVYAHMGDEGKTDRAARRALQLYPGTDTRSPAQIRLMQAFARIIRGDVSEGIRQAQSTYEPLRSAHRTAMVDTLARRILIYVPAREKNRPDVAAYQELMTSSSRQRMIES
jgi:transcriptional regulator with XRE-family HTH domain